MSTASAGPRCSKPSSIGDGGPARTEIVRLLVADGAALQLADAKGVTPLAHATQRGQSAIADILRAGATP